MPTPTEWYEHARETLRREQYRPPPQMRLHGRAHTHKGEGIKSCCLEPIRERVMRRDD